jgi:hypothetical protein
MNYQVSRPAANAGLLAHCASGNGWNMAMNVAP